MNASFATERSRSFSRHGLLPSSPEDVRHSLKDLGARIRAKYGPALDLQKLCQVVNDPAFFHFRLTLSLNTGPLLPGEFAHAIAETSTGPASYTVYVHPACGTSDSVLSAVVLHQAALLLFSHTISAEQAEALGSEVLELGQEEFYRLLCLAAEIVGGDELC